MRFSRDHRVCYFYSFRVAFFSSAHFLCERTYQNRSARKTLVIFDVIIDNNRFNFNDEVSCCYWAEAKNYFFFKIYLYTCTLSLRFCNDMIFVNQYNFTRFPPMQMSQTSSRTFVLAVIKNAWNRVPRIIRLTHRWFMDGVDCWHAHNSQTHTDEWYFCQSMCFAIFGLDSLI